MATSIKPMATAELSTEARAAMIRVLSGSESTAPGPIANLRKLSDPRLCQAFARRMVESEGARVLAVREPILQLAIREKAPKLFASALRVEATTS